jgi:hypothetical protein
VIVRVVEPVPPRLSVTQSVTVNVPGTWYRWLAETPEASGESSPKLQLYLTIDAPLLLEAEPSNCTVSGATPLSGLAEIQATGATICAADPPPPPPPQAETSDATNSRTANLKVWAGMGLVPRHTIADAAMLGTAVERSQSDRPQNVEKHEPCHTARAPDPGPAR